MFDVAVLADGTALLTSTESGYSYSNRLWELDTATGEFTQFIPAAEYEDQYGKNGTLEASLDRTQILFSDGDSADLFLIEDSDIAHHHSMWADGVDSGPTHGVIAVSLEGNLVAQRTGSIHIYDASLNHLLDLGAMHRAVGLESPFVIGLTFDAAGDNLFVLHGSSSLIFQISTADWSIVRTMEVGTPVEAASFGDFGNRLLLSADGSYFTVVTNTGLQLVGNDAVANVFAGTGGDDDFAAGLGDDVISGEAGNDILNGGAGIDRMTGGTGDDSYIVDHSRDRIVELGGQGTDSARSTATFTLSDNVEHLTLGGGGNINGTGNALANSLTGNIGINRLDGRGGADTMAGASGHDTYVVDNVGDLVIEQGSSGNDTVQSSIDYRLPIHVERLELLGTANVDGRGNSGANTITGNAGANLINGGSGNDVIDAGAGDDRVYGHTGNDSLKGGAGLDRFLFNTALGPDNVDKMLDFYAPSDSIYLSRSVFTKVVANGTLSSSAFHQGATAAAADDRIVYDQATGRIFYDADGSGAASAILFATVAAGTPLTNADFIIYS